MAADDLIDGMSPEAQAAYRRALQALGEAGAPFLIGGAYAFAEVTGIERHTKDLDLFVRERDLRGVLAVLEGAGFSCEVAFSHWLAKAWHGDHFLDLIFTSGNAVAPVDDGWFAHACPRALLGVPVLLCAPEELIWSKAFVQERERYDGADVAHLIRCAGPRLDWRRLLGRFGPNWRVLLSHLVLFGFVYPGERDTVPAWVMAELARRLAEETATRPADERLCRGTLLSREQYLVDVERWGYADARLRPEGRMTEDEIARWTAAIEE
ncbi:MAG TPA: hypothetical protein PKD53_13635 [Chloroflexaceae bacterium]|nr:hypothetical protein [Chloroflexaceae bacterium]